MLWLLVYPFNFSTFPFLFIKYSILGLSEPEFYGDLVYKFKKLIGRKDISFQFRLIITRYRRIGYNLNVMRQSACLVFNPIIVDNYAAFFNCTPVGRAIKLFILVGWGRSFLFVAWPTGAQLVFFICSELQ